jgi:TolA-binding protein
LANANYLLGELEFKKQQYNLASERFLVAYEKFVDIDKTNIRGADSLFQLSRSLEMMGKKDGACNSIKKIRRDFFKLPSSLEEKIDIESTKLNCQS